MMTFPTARIATEVAMTRSEQAGRPHLVYPYLNTGRYLVVAEVEVELEVHHPEYLVNEPVVRVDLVDGLAQATWE